MPVGRNPIVLTKADGWGTDGLTAIDPQTGSLVIQVKDPGLYGIYVWMIYDYNPDGQRGYELTYKNDSKNIAEHGWDFKYVNAVGGGLPTIVTESYFVPLGTGDTLTLYGYQNSTVEIGMHWPQVGIVKLGNLQ
jgi:hypothetical protein